MPSLAAVFTCGAFVAWASGGHALAARWNEIDAGLPSAPQTVVALSVAPSLPTDVYALSSQGSIFRSVDAGGRWAQLQGPVHVQSLAIDPKDAANLYATTSHGVVKSIDAGRTWQEANNGLPQVSLALTIDAGDPSRIYAATPDGLYKTIDAGGSWRLTNLADTRAFSSPVIDPKDPSTLYARVLSGGGMAKSVDEGRTWEELHPQYDRPYVITTLTIDPVNGSTLYAGFLPLAFLPDGGSPTGGIFKSTDRGKTWAVNSGFPESYFPIYITVDPTAPSIIYAVLTSNSGGRIVKSTNGGEEWTSVSEGLPANFRGPLALDPTSPGTIYAAQNDPYSDLQSGTIFKSTTGAQGWVRSDRGLPGIDAHVIAVDPATGSTLYAGVGSGVYIKPAGQESWTELTRSLMPPASTGNLLPGQAPAVPVSLVIDFRNPNTVYTWTRRLNGCVAFDRLLFKSIDGGLSWSDRASPPDNPCALDGFLVMDPIDSEKIYLVESDSSDGGYWVLKTEDGGATWSRNLWSVDGWEVFGPNALVVDSHNPALLYAGTANGMYRSGDGGGSWEPIGLKSSNVTAFANDPSSRGVLYAATAGTYLEAEGFRNLFKSTDDGQTWERADEGLAPLKTIGAVVTTLLIVNSNNIYAGTSGGGVYKTVDAGTHWVSLNDGLTDLDVRGLSISPGAAGTLYAATANGIFELSQ